MVGPVRVLRQVFTLAAGYALVAVLVAAEQDELRQGLVAEYFNIDQEIQDFPVLAADRKPEVRRIDKQVNFDSTEGKFAETDMSDCFYARWVGILRVPKDGKY